MTIEFRYESTEARYGVAGPMLVALYKAGDNTAVRHLDALDEIQGGLVKSFGKISTFSVIQQVGSMISISEQVREKSLALNTKYEPHLIGSAIVITSRGLAAVMVRSFFTGFFLLTKSLAPMKTYSNVADGLGWIQGLPGQHAAVSALRTEDIEFFLNHKK